MSKCGGRSIDEMSSSPLLPSSHACVGWNGPATCIPGPTICYKVPTLVLHVAMSYKPKQIKKDVVGTSCGESYRGRPPGPPGLGFRWRKTFGEPESYENLHVDLGYVSKCGGRSIDAMSSSPV